MSGEKLKGRTYEEIHGIEKSEKLKEEKRELFKKVNKGKVPWNKGKPIFIQKKRLIK